MSTMKFCRECNNILYPKEDKVNKVLLYACRNCDHQEVASNKCVFRNELNMSVRSTVLQDVTADPTLARSRAIRCARCNHGQAVFFQGGATATGEDGMTLFYVCCSPNCGHNWRGSLFSATPII